MNSMAVLGLLLGLFLLGLSFLMPLAFAIGAAGIAVVLIIWPGQSYDMLFQTYFSSLDSLTLIAIPFFILAGELMLQGGVSKRLINTASAYIGNVPGSLGIITVLSCMFFAAISGSGPATAAAIGAIMIPAMRKDNYDSGFATSLIAVSGALGPIIPPSILFIMYGVIAEQSISKLFIAGFLPGFVIALALCMYVVIVAKKMGFGVNRERPCRKERLKILNDAKWSLLIPVIILGSIYSGLATPTEAAIIACDYGLIVGFFVYKELSWKKLKAILVKCTSTTGYCLLIMGPASAFAKILTFERIPQDLAEFIYNISSSAIIVMLAINVMLLISGMFIDPLSGLIIMAPLLLPIATGVGIDPLHFGVVLVVNLCIGMCTPPVGINLFVAAGVAGEPVSRQFKWLIPTVLTFIAALVIINIIPALSMWLPSII